MLLHRSLPTTTVIGTRLFVPTILVVLGTGIWMVMEGWEFGQLGVQMSVTLFIAAILVGAVQLSRTSIAAGRAVGSGDHSELHPATQHPL